MLAASHICDALIHTLHTCYAEYIIESASCIFHQREQFVWTSSIVEHAVEIKRQVCNAHLKCMRCVRTQMYNANDIPCIYQAAEAAAAA